MLLMSTITYIYVNVNTVSGKNNHIPAKVTVCIIIKSLCKTNSNLIPANIYTQFSSFGLKNYNH